MDYPEYTIVNGKKYKINTDFRNAIECERISQDDDINDIERALAIICILFGEDALDDKNNYEELLIKAKKFLLCGKEEKKTKDSEVDMDFVEDYAYIKTSFRSDYGIKLDEENIHWWEFMDLMNGLSNSEIGDCCVLNRIRNLRNYNVNDIKDQKEKQRIIDAKKSVALKRTKKKANKEQLESANKLLKDLKMI